MDLFRRKSVTDLQNEAESDHSLKRSLGAVALTMLGIGAIIGTGIFVLTGTVAAQNAGPAVVLSFALAGIVSIFAALCYSEFAAMVPMAGSAYTYGYATLGEFVAWFIGWDLVIEYALSATTVAAPNRYSRMRSQPMIHATNSPIVAYAYVYALPATGIMLANSA